MKIPAFLSRLALVGVAFALTAQLLGAEATKAEVLGVQGTATINGSAAKRGDAIGAGAQLATGAHSALDLFLDVNGPSLTVSENSKLTIEELTADLSGPAPVINTKLKLDEGKITGFVRKSAGDSIYTVVTPTVTAAIRGTKYMISADGFVYVWEGCVDVEFTGAVNNQNRSDLVTHFLVCAGQAFDPRIPGIIVNELPEPPVGNSGRKLSPPAQNERPVSPIQPFAIEIKEGNSSSDSGTRK